MIGPRTPRAPPEDGPLPPATSPAAVHAAAFVGALVKAMRAFALYDARNDAVRPFLEAYRREAAAATAGGPLELRIRPFELARDGESVYRDEDRERSLAFRLFRDGVRVLRLEPGVPWEELRTLLEILAVRQGGVLQGEDDVVTLLRKAEPARISIAAVAGFQQEDGARGADVGGGAGVGLDAPELPAGWDQPFPPLPAPRPIAYAPLPEGALAGLREDDGPEGIARIGVGVAAFLAAAAARGEVLVDEAISFTQDMRDLLLVDRHLPGLAALARLAASAPAGPLQAGLRAALRDDRLLEVVLATLPPGSLAPPPEAGLLLPLVPPGAALRLLPGEADEARCRFLVSIAEARLPADADATVAALPSLPASAARALLVAVLERAPSQAARAATALSAHADANVVVEAARALARPGEEDPTPALVPLLASGSEAVRVAAAEALAARGEAPAAEPLANALLRDGCSHAEADALARALAGVHPPTAARLFAAWLAPRRGLLRALTGEGAREAALRRAAITGLGVLPGADAEARLRSLAEEGDAEQRRHAQAVLARRRAERGRP
jgi:HEAT repeat protein